MIKFEKLDKTLKEALTEVRNKTVKVGDIRRCKHELNSQYSEYSYKVQFIDEAAKYCRVLLMGGFFKGKTKNWSLTTTGSDQLVERGNVL